MQAKGRQAGAADFACTRIRDSSDEDFADVRCPDMSQMQRDSMSKRLAGVRLCRMEVGASGSLKVGCLEESDGDVTVLEDSDDDPDYSPDDDVAPTSRLTSLQSAHDDSEDEESAAPPLPPSVADLLDAVPDLDDDATCIPDTIRWDESLPTLPPHQQCCAHLLNNVLANDVEKCLSELRNSHDVGGAAKANAYQTGMKKLQALWRLKAKSTLVSVMFT